MKRKETLIYAGLPLDVVPLAGLSLAMQIRRLSCLTCLRVMTGNCRVPFALANRNG
jgi:hypothetical protein